MIAAKPSLLIATGNAGKVREFTAMLADAGFDCAALEDFAPMTEPEETGRTFRENACLKASYYAKAAGKWALADDSGLSVRALGDKPGVHSARWASLHDGAGQPLTAASPYPGITLDPTGTIATLTPPKTVSNPTTPGQRPGSFSPVHTPSRVASSDRAAADAANSALLLQQMKSHTDRAARFVCVLALANPAGQVILTAEDSVAGELLHAPRGSGGFGYDPLFLIPSLSKTTAELTPDEKHAISHRGKALRRLRQLIDDTGLPTRTPSLQDANP